MSPQLKLIALDADDLAVISAHVQDARVKACDIIWCARQKRLVIGMSRFDWEQAILGDPKPRRLVAVLRFDRVLACKARGPARGSKSVGHRVLSRRSTRRLGALAVCRRWRLAPRPRMPGV